LHQSPKTAVILPLVTHFCGVTFFGSLEFAVMSRPQ